MTRQTGNHDIKFDYVRGTSTDPNLHVVHANGQFVGYLLKTYNSWRLFDLTGEHSPICLSPRQYAAEHLAFWAGLLDADYNEPTLETVNV